MCKKVPGGITAVHAALSRRVIETGDDVRDSQRHGNKRRNIRNNDVNHNSSSSHVVYQLFIESSPIGGATPTERTRKATLTFGNLYYLIIYFLKLLLNNHFLLFKVDLAGAEPNTNKNAESKNINLSLTFISRYFKGLPNVDPKALPSRNARDDSTKLIELICGCICGSSETTFLFCLAATRRRQCRLTLESAFSLKKIKIDAVANVKRLTQTE